ncbi:MAG: ATP-binding protein [Candidatus Woesearchaeota archaeon]
MEINALKKIILEQRQNFDDEKENLIERDILKKVENYLKLPHALVISGIRRSGKSTLLKQIKKKFFSSSIIYYFNFEDERLINFTIEDFDFLYQSFLEIYGQSKIFFFDEVQNIKGWELFVRRLYDKGFKFFITGSNSSLLSKELGSKLTGRYIPIELYPFSFKEFLKIRKFEIKEIYTTEELSKIRNYFYEYLDKGGFPEAILFNNLEVLNILYDNIIYKDILVRYGLNDEKSLKELSFYAYSNHSKEISFNNLKKILNLGSPNTVKNYLNYLEKSYLIFLVNKYSNSLKEQIYSNKKIYVIDSGLIKKISFKISSDIGRLLENLVFLELKRNNLENYYFKGRNECDFIIPKEKFVIQVTKEINEENKDREIKGIIEAIETLKYNKALIITENQDSFIKINNKKILVKPIWKFLTSFSIK